MPDSFDITGFVISIISLLGLHKLGALVASRLPPGRLKAIKADLAEMRELLEHLECERYPNGAATLHHFQSSLQQAECGGLINDCKDLHGDITDLRVHLHKLPPRARHTYAPQAMHSSASSYTAATSPNPSTDTSVSSASASSTVASSSPSLPETPSPSVSDPAPMPVKADDTTEPAPAADNWGRRMRRTSISSESTEPAEPLQSTEPAPAHGGSHWMKRTARTTLHTPPEEYTPERRRALVTGRSDAPILRNRVVKTADPEAE
ncbi:hypothetical protein TRAPUB_14246 [Trametes pubescens]|uniref:Uncharacterized protein n=1 Tax=Trametes pubescens TaxID=154538 RepID=A0A1M2VNZ2_TRAPU|nr:hypothetical protein TRAPUB_14246 [Trametes pubescens]